MTPEQLEYVAQAFYEAEHSSEWGDAPRAIREHYLGLAETAILLSEDHKADAHPSRRSKVAMGLEGLHSSSGREV